MNAKYIHSSLALRSIKEYSKEFNSNIETYEFTINNDIDFIIESIYKDKPDIIGFSCYIWNFDIIVEIIKCLKRLLPNVKIILGGPEVSYEVESLFDNLADIVILGEGEVTFNELMEYFLNRKGSIASIKGIAYKSENEVIVNPSRELIFLDEIDFVYKNCMNEFNNKIIYYEASRGCPYNCQYCLSSTKEGVRFLSLSRVFWDLNFFLKHNVKQVKFVDRTFNCNKKFAMEIWNHLIQNDNNITNFHFEISADILDEEMLDIVSKARKGLFQFEIGIQSTNLETLDLIKRKTSLEKLFDNVKKISLMKNIHQHLDLIVGLPGEDYASFKNSFNEVFLLFPEQLQIGFLKLLKGSGLRNDADKFGIVYKEKSPYEVLYTNDISYEEIRKLKSIEDLVETYYNSGKSVYIIIYLLNFFKTPFDFFNKLSDYWEEKSYNLTNHDKIKLYLILYEFGENYVDSKQEFLDIIRFDILQNDNFRSLPDWLCRDDTNELRNSKYEFFNNKDKIIKKLPELSGYNSKQMSRQCNYERFGWDIVLWINSDYTIKTNVNTNVLFSYTPLKKFYKADDILKN